MSVHPGIISTKRHYLVIGNVKMLQKFKQAKQFFAGTVILKASENNTLAVSKLQAVRCSLLR